MARSKRVSTEDPGRKVWFETDEESGKDIYLFIRPMTQAMIEEARKLFGVPKRNKRTGVKDLIIPRSKRRQVGDFYALKMWVNTKNWWTRPEDEQAAKVLSEELGEKVEVGQEACLDDRWTDRLKRDELHEVKLINLINKEGSEQKERADAEEAEEEEDLLGNSSASSSSSSPTKESPKIVAEPA